ncbi:MULTISPECIES: hypothetical protein [Henriciella]|jgi:hypothetical protein|uniref:TIGR02301 family protein n=1 Tax=Henriciella pelagia TaxID=1977912 RepID=A0ABQ1JFX2_9PROT|nr:hypothetical protein [Henriciella pelagia]GGB67948.1 hypothetical protein GCM10011503_15780 [Henriciella pelagia]
MKIHFAVAGVLAGALAAPGAIAANNDVSNAQLYASLIKNNFQCDALIPAAEQIEASFANWDAIDRAEIVDAFTLLAQPEQEACGSLRSYAAFMSGLAGSSPAVFDAELHLSKRSVSTGTRSSRGDRFKAAKSDFSLFSQSSEMPSSYSPEKTSDYRN